jgi:hypothetical protein
VLFALIALSDMDKNDRVRACYLHTCLKYVISFDGHLIEADPFGRGLAPIMVAFGMLRLQVFHLMAI